MRKMYAILSANTRGHTEQGQKSQAEEYICFWKCSTSQKRGKLLLRIRKLNVSEVTIVVLRDWMSYQI